MSPVVCPAYVRGRGSGTTAGHTPFGLLLAAIGDHPARHSRPWSIRATSLVSASCANDHRLSLVLPAAYDDAAGDRPCPVFVADLLVSTVVIKGPRAVPAGDLAGDLAGNLSGDLVVPRLLLGRARTGSGGTASRHKPAVALGDAPPTSLARGDGRLSFNTSSRSLSSICSWCPFSFRSRSWAVGACCCAGSGSGSSSGSDSGSAVTHVKALGLDLYVCGVGLLPRSCCSRSMYT